MCSNEYCQLPEKFIFIGYRFDHYLKFDWYTECISMSVCAKTTAFKYLKYLVLFDISLHVKLYAPKQQRSVALKSSFSLETATVLP